MASYFQSESIAQLPSFGLATLDLDLLYRGLSWVLEEHECPAVLLTAHAAGPENENLCQLCERLEHYHIEPAQLGLPQDEWLLLFVSPQMTMLASALYDTRQLELKVSFENGPAAEVLRLMLASGCDLPVLKDLYRQLADTDTQTETAFRYLLRLVDHRQVTRVNEPRMYRLAEQSLDLIYRIQINPTFRILYISPIIESWMGCTREALYQDATVAFRHIHPQDAKLLQRMMVEDRSKQGVTLVRFLPAEGEPVWIEHRWFVDRSTDRSVIVLDGVGRDITRQKRQEEATSRALRTAEENARSKSLFLANMSHEIRTPLNAIIGQVELLRDTPLDPDQREMLDSVLSAGKILLSHLTDVLDFSQLDAERVQLHKVAFSPTGALTETLGLMKEVAREKGLALTTRYAPDTPDQVIGDRGRFMQIVLNLVSNAIKFTDQGSVQLELDGRLRGDKWLGRVRVVDTGIGFPMEDFEKLTLPFSQADPSSTRKREGSGLGLAIVKRLVDLMGASLSVQSEPHKGTCFELEFEFLATAAGLPADSLPTSPGAIPPELKILVVEDNEVNRKVIRRQLSTLGLSNIDFACNGGEAIEILKPGHHQVVLMDIQMPVLDGVESLTLLKKMYPDLQIPFIAVTANALPGDRETYLRAGFQGYLSKPVGLEQLRTVLGEVLG